MIHPWAQGVEPALRAVVWPLLLSVDDPHGSFEERAAARLERRRRFHTLHAHRLTMHALAAEDATAAASTSGPTMLSALPTSLQQTLSSTGEYPSAHTYAATSSSLRRDTSAVSAVSAVVSDTGADVGAGVTEVGLGEMAEMGFSFLDPRASVMDEEERQSSSTTPMPPLAVFSEASTRIQMDAPRTAPPFEEQRLKRAMSGSRTTTTAAAAVSSSSVCELQVRAQAPPSGGWAHSEG